MDFKTLSRGRSKICSLMFYHSSKTECKLCNKVQSGLLKANRGYYLPLLDKRPGWSLVWPLKRLQSLVNYFCDGYQIMELERHCKDCKIKVKH